MPILKTGHSIQQNSFPTSPIRKKHSSLQGENQRKGRKKSKNDLPASVPSWEVKCPFNEPRYKNRVGKNNSPQRVYSNTVLFPALSLG